MLAAKIAHLLLTTKTVQINLTQPYKWTSGILSPIYCDNRLLTASPTSRQTIVNGFLTVIQQQQLKFDCVAGVATGAIAFGVLVADHLQKPFCFVRPEPRTHGTGKQVEGYQLKRKKILVIEDLFSTGGSTLKAIKALRKELAAKIIGSIAISTYEFPETTRKLRAAKVPFWTLTNFHAIVNSLKIPPAQKAALLKFRQNPHDWPKTL